MIKKTALALCAVATIVTAGTEPLKVGDAIPAINLMTPTGESFDLQAAVKKQPLVIIFYRGGWCPYCNRHLSDLQTIDPQLQELGYTIIAISPDIPAELAKSSEKNGLGYTLLSDSSMAAAKAFGLAFTVDDATLVKYEGYGIDLEAASGEKHHMLPVPAVFIAGTDGIIDFAHSDENYKKRLASAKVLAAAKAALE